MYYIQLSLEHSSYQKALIVYIYKMIVNVVLTLCLNGVLSSNQKMKQQNLVLTPLVGYQLKQVEMFIQL